MGGKGSNRWRTYKKKLCVEECRVLSIRKFMPLNCDMKSGKLKVFGPQVTDEPLVMRFFFRSKGYIQPNLNLDVYSGRTGKILFSQCLSIVKTDLLNKGSRFWFYCAGVKYEKFCGRKVRKLYLYSEEQCFKCRYCCELTYKSSQTFDGLKRKLRRTVESMGIDLCNL